MCDVCDVLNMSQGFKTDTGNTVVHTTNATVYKLCSAGRGLPSVPPSYYEPLSGAAPVGTVAVWVVAMTAAFAAFVFS